MIGDQRVVNIAIYQLRQVGYQYVGLNSTHTQTNDPLFVYFSFQNYPYLIHQHPLFPGNNQNTKLEQFPTVLESKQIKEDLETQNLKKVKINNSAEQFDLTNFHKQPRNYTQNRTRNVLPNLVRLILSFTLSRSKSQKLIKQIAPNMDIKLQKDFYKYIQRIKSQTKISDNGYVAQSKLKDIFGLSESCYFGNRSIRKRSEKQQLFKEIIRKISFFYLSNIMPLSIIGSKKMSKSLKTSHLSKRNQLISILRKYPNPLL